MKLIVCGGRDFADRAFLFAALDAVHRKRPVSLVIHGDAPGADRLAGTWAAARGIPVEAVPAQWKIYGRRAGPWRNFEMLQLKPDGVVAFPGGRGTADMISQALEAGVTVWQPKP